ncbi:hypothetical protein JCM19233_6650 [Vibrio astriarenae]|nr:hypothetical protein JCM19233_6650 [Vibrio sp. C7]
MRQGFKFPMALWCPHSKQISDIKKSLIAAIHDYVDNVYQIENN